MFKKRKTSTDRKSSSARNNNASQETSETKQNFSRDFQYSFQQPQCNSKNVTNSSSKKSNISTERAFFEELHKACYLIEPIPASANKNRSASALSNSRSVSGSKPTDESSNSIIGYQYTYRAVLARKGYLVRDTLGSGSYSKVKKVLNCNSSPVGVAAVKIIDRLKTPKDYQDKFMPRELELWPHLVHPNLVRLQDCFQDSRRVYMLLEYVPGGDALQYIQKHGAINEEMARQWTSQILDAVGYMHEREISHRDLKLENLLLTEDKQIKICDFGFIKRQGDVNDLSRTYCGSRSYAAPEILTGRPYDPKKTDVWAIGVIVYIFVLGIMPFDETKGTKSVLKEQENMEGQWKKLQNRLSAPCYELLLQMFAKDFNQRPDVKSLLKSFWFHNLSLPVRQPRIVEQRSSNNTIVENDEEMDFTDQVKSFCEKKCNRNVIVSNNGENMEHRSTDDGENSSANNNFFNKNYNFKSRNGSELFSRRRVLFSSFEETMDNGESNELEVEQNECVHNVLFNKQENNDDSKGLQSHHKSCLNNNNNNNDGATPNRSTHSKASNSKKAQIESGPCTRSRFRNIMKNYKESI